MPFVIVLLYWTIVVILLWAFTVQVVLRIIRRYVHFPMPAFFNRLIDNPLRRRIQSPRKIIDWMGLSPNTVILEIGAGPGTFTIEAARRIENERRVVALDVQPAMISVLVKKLEKEKMTNVESIIGSALSLPFLDDSFDGSFMITVLGELPDKSEALLEVRRVLRGEGELAIGELLFDPDYPRKKTILRLCKDAGFELISEYGRFLHYLLVFRKPA
ncbi:MAG: class I SAM-dependent methyltransferase [Candidatus Baldrarchaeia archaeon]